jgi:outer membrane protein assembly factor BamB
MSTAVPQDILAPAAPVAPRQIRLWPGVVIVVLMWAGMIVPKYLDISPFYQFMAMFSAPVVGAALVLLWWLFASRTPWSDRLLLPVACVCLAGDAYAVLHPSFKMGPIMYGLPAVLTTWVGWLLVTGRLGWRARRAGLIVLFALAWGSLDLFRFDGIDGDFNAEISWRWAPTAEQKFLAGRPKPTAPTAASVPVALRPGDWPGFRGPQRDNRLTGVRLVTDWEAHPPKPVWKHRVGPGWGSFAVVGDRLFTQEQRDDNEVVVCYRASDGQELWEHTDRVRFTEEAAGPGPRATPTFHDGKLYALGAKGTLNCLDPATGKVIWSKDIAADSGAKVPIWGFASSPLVVNGTVTVYAGGPDKAVLGYKADTGDLAWASGQGPMSYCSTHLAKFDGVEQLLIATDAGLSAFDPATGKVLWTHDWQTDNQLARIVQPTLLEGGDVLIGTGMGVGTRRVHVGREGDGWSAKEVWTTQAIKPYYNDLVMYKDHLYGFDGTFFVCVTLADGKLKWKARGYGAGQVLLLADQGVLLIASEKGEVALVAASPERHQELGKFQAIEGKTWNHPVLAHGRLYVRNGEEAACYQLAEEAEKVAGR